MALFSEAYLISLAIKLINHVYPLSNRKGCNELNHRTIKG